MTIRPIIFDMDGTLIDSVDVVLSSFQRTMKEVCGRDMPKESFLPFVGPPLQESFTVLGEDPSVMIPEYRSRYRERQLDVPLYPGVKPMLAALSEAGIPTIIATSKDQANATLLADHLGITDYLVAVCGADEKRGRALKAAIVGDALDILAAQGWDRTQAVMVGDRKYDVIGAAEHNLPTVLVGWGPTPEDEFGMAWKVGRTPEEMTQLLLSLSR